MILWIQSFLLVFFYLVIVFFVGGFIGIVLEALHERYNKSNRLLRKEYIRAIRQLEDMEDDEENDRDLRRRVKELEAKISHLHDYALEDMEKIRNAKR